MEIKELRLLVDLVCNVLNDVDKGADWQRQPDNEGRWIDVHNKASRCESVWFELTTSENKLHVRGHFPSIKTVDGRSDSLAPYRPYNHRGQWYEMGISAKKPPADLAQSIFKRLIIDYREALNKGLETHDKYNRELTERQELRDELLATYFPDAQSSTRNEVPSIYFQHDNNIAGIDHGEITVHSPNNTELNMTIRSPELFRAIFETIRKHSVENQPEVVNG